MSSSAAVRTKINIGLPTRKRPIEASDYREGSDLHHGVFNTDGGAQPGIIRDESSAHQQQLRQEANDHWQKEHDQLSGPNKRPRKADSVRTSARTDETYSSGRSTNGTTRSSGSAGQSTRESSGFLPGERSIEEQWAPAVERLRAIDAITKRPAAKPLGEASGTEISKEENLGTEEKTGTEKKRKSTRNVHFAETATRAQPDLRRGSSRAEPRMRRVVESLGSHPKLPRTDQDFEEAMAILKTMIKGWSSTYFPHTLTDTEKQKFNLYKLAQGSPELMEYAGWILAGGPVEKWRNHFVNWRPSLVYGLLGKMLEIHVFGHTMFGATPAQLATLEAMDLSLIDTDGASPIAICTPSPTAALTSTIQVSNAPKSAPP